MNVCGGQTLEGLCGFDITTSIKPLMEMNLFTVRGGSS